MSRRTAGCILLIIAAFLLGFGTGGRAALHLHHAPAVCHAVTEDSTMYDCAYVHGAWVRK